MAIEIPEGEKLFPRGNTIIHEGTFIDHDTLHFIFQPAEEGRGGAKRLVQDGLFKRFPCDAVFGLHYMPGLAVNEIAVAPGPQLASSDSWKVTFIGVGSHSAKPHLGRDAITVTGHFLSALQSITGRIVDPLEPAVISASSVQAGNPNSLNVIPDTVEIGGTARAYTTQVRDQLEIEIGARAKGLAAVFGITLTYCYIRRIPPVVNDPAAKAESLAAAIDVCGESVRTNSPRSTAGDDFADLCEEVPGCYVWLGNGPACKGALHHNSAYDFNDAAIPTGVNYWVRLVERQLCD